MIYSKAANPNCMYLWMNYIISPEAQAKVAEFFGEAPVNTKACELTENPNHCTDYHAEDEAWWNDVYYWTTPTADCGGTEDDGTCVTQEDWKAAWTEIEGRCSRLARARRPALGRPMAAMSVDDVDRRSRSSAAREAGPGAPPLDVLSIGTRGCDSPGCSRARWAGWSSRTSGRCSSSCCPRSGRRTRSPQRSSTSGRWTTSATFRESRLPQRHLADDEDGRPRHARGRGARVPDRVLHGAGRIAPDAEHPRGRRADAALGQLPREGVRLADDARERRRPRLGARARSASTSLGSRPSDSGSCSRTSGSRS